MSYVGLKCSLTLLLSTPILISSCFESTIPLVPPMYKGKTYTALVYTKPKQCCSVVNLHAQNFPTKEQAHIAIMASNKETKQKQTFSMAKFPVSENHQNLISWLVPDKHQTKHI